MPTATRAPSASSHARVNGEKYAEVGDEEVMVIDSQYDATMITAKTTAIRARSDRPTFAPATTRNSVG